MLEFNSKKENCTGCSACYSACPKQCIQMKTDAEGFLYPEASEDCIHCGLCEKVCPIQAQLSFQNDKKKVLVGTAYDYPIWNRSSSGGAFSSICRAWGDDETIIFGAAWDGLKVHHIGVKGVDKIYALCKSKYLASAIEDSFIQVRDYLKQGKKVIFCGTPCQVAGLRLFLRKGYDNLLLIDLICHGSSSPSVFATCIDDIERQAGKKVVNYTFRHKIQRYEQDYVSAVTFEDGTSMRIDSDQYIQLFLSRASHRPCCGNNCKFRNSNRPGDITLADARGMKYYLHEHYDSTRNYSFIIANNEKGNIAIKDLVSYMKLFSCSIDDVVKYNPLYDHNVPHENKRDAFFREYTENPQKTVQKYTKPFKRHKLTFNRLIKLYTPKWLYNSIIYKFVG